MRPKSPGWRNTVYRGPELDGCCGSGSRARQELWDDGVPGLEGSCSGGQLVRGAVEQGPGMEESVSQGPVIEVVLWSQARD